MHFVYFVVSLTIKRKKMTLKKWIRSNISQEDYSTLKKNIYKNIKCKENVFYRDLRTNNIPTWRKHNYHDYFKKLIPGLMINDIFPDFFEF